MTFTTFATFATFAVITFAAAPALAPVLTPSLRAGTIFQFGPAGGGADVGGPDKNAPRYVTRDTPFARAALGTGTGAPRDPCEYLTSFSDTIPLSPAAPAYTGPVFYGGIHFLSATLPADTLRQRVARSSQFGANHGPGVRYLNALALTATRRDGWPGSPVALTGAILFKLDPNAARTRTTRAPAGASADGVAIDGLSVTVARWGALADYNRSRWLIQTDGRYFVSEKTFGFPLNGATPVTTRDPELSTLRWARYNPAENLHFDATPEKFAPLPLPASLKHVTAAGVYFTASSQTGIPHPVAFSWELGEFSVSGPDGKTAEPGTGIEKEKPLS
ncbi:MAG: hypothetical protein LBK99_09755 [Opitutaceae bacterium]|nr:hypothetical protein [Opitutaceae bacterium]